MLSLPRRFGVIPAPSSSCWLCDQRHSRLEVLITFLTPSELCHLSLFITAAAGERAILAFWGCRFQFPTIKNSFTACDFCVRHQNQAKSLTIETALFKGLSEHQKNVVFISLAYSSVHLFGLPLSAKCSQGRDFPAALHTPLIFYCGRSYLLHQAHACLYYNSTLCIS